MSERSYVNIDGPSYGWGWIVAFLCFWAAGGWERVDCALGIKPACTVVQAWREPETMKKE